jgi:hypothetical protein
MTCFSSGQLFETAMQFFDLSAHLIRILSDLRGQIIIWAIGDEHQSMLPSVATILNMSGSIPTVEQDALGFDFLGKNRIDNHVGKMIVLGLPILLRHINLDN